MHGEEKTKKKIASLVKMKFYVKRCKELTQREISP